MSAPLVPIKNDGRMETVEIMQPGPISYAETTTLTRIFAEDANRCLVVNSDETPQQTKRIVSKVASLFSGGGVRAPADVLNKHHALQRMLLPLAVVVPFAEKLGELLPFDRIQVRRAFPQLLVAVQASALLHQRQRKLDVEGRLVADILDYEIARYLLAGPMAQAVGGRVCGPALRFLKRLREWFGGATTFTVREAGQRETGSPRSVRGWIAELHDGGLVELVQASQGNLPAKWRVAGTAEDTPESVLPSVAELVS